MGKGMAENRAIGRREAADTKHIGGGPRRYGKSPEVAFKEIAKFVLHLPGQAIMTVAGSRPVVRPLQCRHDFRRDRRRIVTGEIDGHSVFQHLLSSLFPGL
jgi:hypothetical protein